MTDRLQVTGDDGRVWEWEPRVGGVWRLTDPRGGVSTHFEGWVDALLSEVVRLRARVGERDRTAMREGAKPAGGPR